MVGVDVIDVKRTEYHRIVDAKNRMDEATDAAGKRLLSLEENSSKQVCEIRKLANQEK